MRCDFYLPLQSKTMTPHDIKGRDSDTCPLVASSENELNATCGGALLCVSVPYTFLKNLCLLQVGCWLSAHKSRQCLAT